MEQLTKEEVNHVAHLARIALTDEERSRFQVQLKQLLVEVEKIMTITGYDDEIMFTPIEGKARIREDDVLSMLSASEALKNTPCKNGNFMEVPVMINE